MSYIFTPHFTNEETEVPHRTSQSWKVGIQTSLNDLAHYSSYHLLRAERETVSVFHISACFHNPCS